MLGEKTLWGRAEIAVQAAQETWKGTARQVKTTSRQTQTSHLVVESGESTLGRPETSLRTAQEWRSGVRSSAV